MKAKNFKFTVHESTSIKEYYWRCRASNGNEICRSSETYQRRGTCVRILKKQILSISDGNVAYNLDKEN